MRTRSFRAPAALLAVSSLAALALACSISFSDVEMYFTVTKTEDTHDGSCTEADCSLREAVVAANGRPGLDHIRLHAGVYVLSLHGAGGAGVGDLEITGDVTITGDDWTTVVIDGDHDDRIFDIQEGTVVELRDLTLQYGNAHRQADQMGGCVRNMLGILTLANIRFQHCFASQWGGAIYNAGELTASSTEINNSTALYDGGGGLFHTGGTARISNSVLNNNWAASGGGIYNQGLVSVDAGGQAGSTVLLQNVSFTGNRADLHGGGIYNGVDAVLEMRYGAINSSAEPLSPPSDVTALAGGGLYNAGTLDLDTVAVQSNLAAAGAGLYNADSGAAEISNSGFRSNAPTQILNAGSLEMSESAIYGDLDAYSGGVRAGIHSNWELSLVNVTVSVGGEGIRVTGGKAVVTNATIAGNHTGIYQALDGQIALQNTIVADNVLSDCEGDVYSYGHNLDHHSTCGFSGPGDLVNTDPQLDAMQNYGFQVFFPLLATSLAIDTASMCYAFDQRGWPRPFGPACDIGAIEFGAPEPAPRLIPTLTGQPSESPASATASLTPQPYIEPSLTWTPRPSDTPPPPPDTATPSPQPSPTPTATRFILIVTVKPIGPSATAIP
jgi:CSLREA domain-containing protein